SLPPRYGNETGDTSLCFVQVAAMAQAPGFEEFFAVIARNNHDGLLQINFLDDGGKPGVEFEEAVLVAVGDLIAMADRIPTLEVEVYRYLGLKTTVFGSMAIGVMLLEVKKEQEGGARLGKGRAY